MNKQNTNKPELLAPAGNLNCALAALQSGADAVYAGISRFNAREMGENFSWEDMSRLSAYTKKNNKRFYLTLNTLVKEHELEEFGASVEKISMLKPDAVIVQDIGVIRFLREYFPSLSIHGSTQMGIHNSDGVMAASDMGLERVILERQVTMEELKTICKKPVEIEVFIHGALCCSISGHCLFSSWLGGWSGNRGRCKQPCRRRFHGEEDGNKKSGFFFSTRDFYSLDMLDELADAGVCSLKIEGRLKKPDYVRSVVTAYRMMLDTDADQKFSTLKEARAVLAGSYGRKWSHGFATAEDMESLIQFDSAGVSGRLAGSVEKTARNGFEASVIQRLHIGDRIRIQPRSGDEGPSITITKMSRDRAAVKSAVKGSKVFIHCDKEVSPRSLIYKIGESSSESVKRPAEMPLFDPPLELSLKIAASAAGLEVRAELPDGRELLWRDSEPVDAAQNRPLEASTLEEAFRVTRNSELSVSRVNVSISTNDAGTGLFIPAGRLKKTRRAFWEWLEEQPELTEAMENSAGAAPVWRENFIADRKKYAGSLSTAAAAGSKAASKLPAAYHPYDSRTGVKLPIERINVLDAASFIDGPSRSVTGPEGIHELLLPFFCPENRLNRLEEIVKKAWEKGIRRFRITSLYQFRLLQRALGSEPAGSIKLPEDISLSVSFPLPAANSMAARELQSLGAGRVQIWLELDKDAIEKAASNWPVIAEIYRRGKPFLLATRADLSIEGKITDSRGKEFMVEKPPVSDLDFSEEGSSGALGFVFPAEVISLPEQPGCSEYFELNRITGDEKETGFNYDFALI
ncbi:MAG: DUF3656 domain-containing protein [Spirochaetales bacterium]|uniref:DUF3656 domain-containing protein n=1 Tax=Candidatus Thalassospirochaeta sargassi TaxID=3119039 RepID=A0AAJ1IET6_9SPIO|nr:DUF3656 domain-containing protein [Spirochaetales bacterium]